MARGHRDEVDGVRFEGEAAPAPGVLQALAQADAIVIAPSNPTSIWPILAVAGVRDALAARTVPCIAVSPLVGGRAVKGPADRMLARMAGGTTEHVAGCYAGLIDALVVDESDPAGGLAVRRIATRTLMTDLAASRRLAETVLEPPHESCGRGWNRQLRPGGREAARRRGCRSRDRLARPERAAPPPSRSAPKGERRRGSRRRPRPLRGRPTPRSNRPPSCASRSARRRSSRSAPSSRSARAA